MKTIHITLLGSILLGARFELPAENWPEFRGAGGQGHASANVTGLPVHWGPDRNVAWKTPIPGRGWSSPVVVDGRIYLTTALVEESGDLQALCLDEKSGRILWRVTVFEGGGAAGGNMHRKNSQASPTPVVEGDRIYAHFGHLGTACLDRSGKVIWRNSELSYAPVHGNGGSPVIVDDILFFSCDGAKDPFVAALDKRTGRVRWTTGRTVDASKKFSFCTALAITVDGQKQIISPGSDMVGAYDPRNGREIWKVRYDGYSVVPRPVFGHGLLFISTGFDRPVVMAIRPGGRGDVTDTHVAWTVRRSGPNTPSMLLAGDELYMVSDSGIASCLDARTGEVHWQERVGGNYSSSPVYADGRIYLQSEEGKGVVLQPGKEFKVLAENELKETSLASYAVAQDSLLIRTEGHLYAIRNGE